MPFYIFYIVPKLTSVFSVEGFAICRLSLLLVLFSAPRGFSPVTPVFSPPQKPTFPNSNSIRNQVDEEALCGCATSKSLFIYLFILFTHYYLFFLFRETS